MAKKIVETKFADFKNWYQSKTIIGLIISSVSAIVDSLTQGKVDIQGAAGEILNAGEVAQSADQIISAVTFFIGQAVALWGRITAKAGIKTK
mgnify:FL=1